MSLVAYYQRERAICIMPDPSSATFVAKIQKAKTRKGKDYFVLRVTLPKDVASKIDAQAGDYLFFKAKKAEWYHMLDWERMENTWRLLPEEIKYKAIIEGLIYPGAPDQATMTHLIGEDLKALAATNPTNPPAQIEERATCKPTQGGI